MLIVIWVAAAFAGLIHVLLFCMESLWWTKPAVYRRFRSTETQAQTTKGLSFNQGFYNLFLAAGTLGGLALIATGHPRAGMTLSRGTARPCSARRSSWPRRRRRCCGARSSRACRRWCSCWAPFIFARTGAPGVSFRP